ncbi:MAG: ComEC/Rec2 family competence protein [Thermoleophilaceae bacterium]|nr:ComEC/Rec2 family competence protein [Thermoleophilaceae bacterium]
MRPTTWHVAMAALAAGLLLAGTPAVALLAAAGVLAGAAILRPGAIRPAALAAGLVVAGVWVGDMRLAAIDAPAARVRDGARLSARAWVLTAPRPGRFGSSAEARIASGRLRGARLLLRAPLWSPLPEELRPGAGLTVTGRLGALDRGDDYDDYLSARGIAAELALDRVRPTGVRRGGVAGALDGARERAEGAVAAGMEPRAAALLRGMVLGEDEAVDPVAREDFRASGLAHLLAVSGQNVMLLAALALPLLLLAGVGPHARPAALALLIVLYVPLAGAGPSLQRAGVMGLAGLAAIGLSRPASRSYALLLAAVATLAWNPRSAADPGWQLSFAAVAGILAIGAPLGRALGGAAAELAPGRAERAARALADGVAITVAATLATAPLLAHHFGSIPLAGLPANVLALPAVAPAMWLGMLKAALGQVPAPAAAATAAALGAPAEVAVRYLAWLAERFADVPGGQIRLALGSPLAVASAYGALAAGAWGLCRAARGVTTGWPERAAAWRRLPRSRRVALAAAALVPMCALALGGPAPPDRLTVRFLDVGQGDATLIQHPDGTAVLFDGGPPEAGVARLLRRAGVRRLDLVVATHPSRDHHGGLAGVLERFPVGALLDGGDGTPDPSFRALERAAAARGIRRIPGLAPLTLALAGGDLVIEVLSPPPRPPGPAPEDPNPRALVAVVRSGAFSLLLSADAESDALLPLDLPDVDAMKVPHHGSADAGLAEALTRLRPELAAIEVGEGNTYGHPAPSTLAALRRAGVPAYRTDEDGTVTLTVGGGAGEVTTER